MVNLEKLFGVEAAQRMKTAGLHQMVAGILEKEGHAVGNELDLRSAIQALGTNLYAKNAEYKAIRDGLLSLNELNRG